MKRLAATSAVLAVLGLVGAPARARAGQDRPEKPKTKRKKKPAATKPALRGAHAIMAKVCELSEEQAGRIAELMAARQKALKAWEEAHAEKNKAARDALKAARDAKDKDAAAKARDELSALRKARDEIVSKSQAEIMAVLTDEQKARWDRYHAVQAVKRRFRTVEFSDEQVKQIEALCAKAEMPDASDRKARSAALDRLYAQVSKDVLTDSQRLDIAMGMIKAMFRKAELTDEQLAKIKGAYVEHMSGVDPADAKARRAAMRKLQAEVREKVLTDAQREALKKLQAGIEP